MSGGVCTAVFDWEHADGRQWLTLSIPMAARLIRGFFRHSV